MPYKQPISTLVVIYTADLQVLLLKRADFPDAWQSVTGSVEGNESLRDTAMREVFEETSIDLRQSLPENWFFSDWNMSSEYSIYEQWRYRYPPGTANNKEHVFSLQLPHPVAITLSVLEHTDYQWLDWQAAAEIVFSPSNAEAIRLLSRL